MGLGVHRPSMLDAAAVAALSQGALDRGLAHEAELTIAPISGDAVLIGAFDRAPSNVSPVFRRGSGGPPIRAAAGMVYVGLALAHPAALVPCTPDKLLNRYVRPVLRALTKVAAPAHYFGRDWVSVAKRPAAWIGFSHDAGTRRALVEAFIAVRAPFHLGARASFLGKEPGTLESIADKTIDDARLLDAIAAAFGDAVPCDVSVTPVAPLTPEPAWKARVEEAIGDVCAGRDAAGAMRVGGEFLASRDAVVDLEARFEELGPEPDDASIGRIVNEAFTRPGVALEGVRSLDSFRKAILAALPVTR